MYWPRPENYWCLAGDSKEIASHLLCKSSMECLAFAESRWSNRVSCVQGVLYLILEDCFASMNMNLFSNHQPETGNSETMAILLLLSDSKNRLSLFLFAHDFVCRQSNALSCHTLSRTSGPPGYCRRKPDKRPCKLRLCICRKCLQQWHWSTWLKCSPWGSHFCLRKMPGTSL
jgi:hypothetical protein